MTFFKNLPYVIRMLFLRALSIVRPLSSRQKLRYAERRYYSQNGEDGILHHIFSCIGIKTHTVIEFGCGSGDQCCSASLIINSGWNALLFDGCSSNCERAEKFFRSNTSRMAHAPRIVQAFMTCENINSFFIAGGMQGEIDLLIIDVDGVDYWLWKAVTAVNPRVVVIEYNASFGKERMITVPYKESFNRHTEHESGLYANASLSAYAALGNTLNYALIGCDSAGVNAFFVRRDALCADTPLAKIRAENAWYPHSRRVHLGTSEEQFGIIKDLPFYTIPEGSRR